MELYGFLAGSLELLTLLESIEQRQEKISLAIARLETAPAGDAMRSMLVAHLRAEQRAAEAELQRAADLLSAFQ